MTDKLIERVARAIADHCCGATEEAARAALATLEPGDFVRPGVLVKSMETIRCIESRARDEGAEEINRLRAQISGYEACAKDWSRARDTLTTEVDELRREVPAMSLKNERATEEMRERCCDEFDRLLQEFLVSGKKEASFDEMIAKVRALPLKNEDD